MNRKNAYYSRKEKNNSKEDHHNRNENSHSSKDNSSSRTHQRSDDYGDKTSKTHGESGNQQKSTTARFILKYKISKQLIRMY